MKKLIFLSTLSTLALCSSAFGATIPKLDLATCEINKADLDGWFYAYSAEERAALDSVVDPLALKVQQVNLIDRPGIANFYTVSIRGADADGKNVKKVQRTLKQLAVSFSGDSISVGYAPYDVSRTSSQPFSLLIEKDSPSGDATGFLAVVPLQSASSLPLKPIKLNCKVSANPAQEVRITREEVAALEPKAQFELIHNLYRLGMTGKHYSLDDRPTEEIGLSAEVLNSVRSEISAKLSARRLPPLPRWTDPKPKVTVIEGDRCGTLDVSYIIPVYDSATARELRRVKNPELKKQAVGYILTRVRCESPARLIESAGRLGQPDVADHNWSATDVVITAGGLIEGVSFSASAFNIY